MKFLLLLLLVSCAVSDMSRYVIDGDTFVLNNGSVVRLAGVDTPEFGDINYDVASFKLQSLVQGKKLVLIGNNSDVYGRLVRDVFVDGTHINLELVRLGFARAAWHEGTLYESALNNAQAIAVQKKIGIWNIDDSAYVRLSHHCESLGCPGAIAIGSDGDTFYNCACGSAGKIKNPVCFATLQDAIALGKREARQC